MVYLDLFLLGALHIEGDSDECDEEIDQKYSFEQAEGGPERISLGELPLVVVVPGLCLGLFLGTGAG